MIRHPPHRLDLGAADWLAAAAALGRRDDRPAREAVERLWAPAGDGLAFLSVRSAFDCALTALDWPSGSEVLVSSVNIREMVDLLHAHALVPVPLDLDPRTMQPTAEGVLRAITPRTRGILIAHLFGAQADAGALFDLARAHGLICFEDAAQAFRGPADRGDHRADATFFSFGTIKTATALGGALARVSNTELRARMTDIQATWPVQRRRAYALRLTRALALLGLQRPIVYTLFCAACRLGGTDGGSVARRLTRGFGAGDGNGLVRAIRQRPCAPLLVTLRRRLVRFAHRGAPRLEARRRWGLEVAGAATVPGADHAVHTHWLIPVLVDDVVSARAALRSAGIEASGPSNVVALGPSALLDRLVFVPAYPELPRSARRSLLRVLPRPSGQERSC